MTREQVRFALGTPMLTSALHSNRWDYPYYYRAGSGKIEERTLTIFFNGAQLESWRGEEQPELQPFQIAREEVRTTLREDKQIKLDNERLNNDGAAAVQLIPGVNIDQMQTNGPPLSDPQALPGAPEDAPVLSEWSVPLPLSVFPLPLRRHPRYRRCRAGQARRQLVKLVTFVVSLSS
jgi:hypothetical protein